MNKKSLALKNVASRSDLLFLARKLLLPNVRTIFEWYVNLSKSRNFTKDEKLVNLAEQ